MSHGDGSPKAFAKWRKRLQTWRKVEGSPFNERGRSVSSEVVAWADEQGLLERAGRPTDVDVLMAPSASPKAPGARSVAAGAGDALSEEDLALLEAAWLRGTLGLAGLPKHILRVAHAVTKVMKDGADADKKKMENKERARQLLHVDDVRHFLSKQSGMVTGARNWLPARVGEGCRDKARAIAAKLPDELAAEFLGMVYEIGHDSADEAYHGMLKRFALECPW